MDALDTVLTDTKTAMLLLLQTFFRGVEALETQYKDSVAGRAEFLAKAYAEGELDEVAEDVVQLLSEREALTAMISATHELHVNKLLAVVCVRACVRACVLRAQADAAALPVA